MRLRSTDILTQTRAGLYCPLGNFHIDPIRPVNRALVTHGHSDHARSGHGAVSVRFTPAGHVLGSAQVVIEAGGTRLVVSGDYKRVEDPTCAAYELVPCDVFITEATFGLPVFHHADARSEIRKLLDSAALFPERAHVVGA